MKKLITTALVCCGFAALSYAQPVADFSGNPTTICAGKAVTWTNLSTSSGNGNCGGNECYAWSFPGATNPTSTSQTPGPRTYNTPGTYTVTLIVTDNNGADTMIKPNYITVIASPTITVSPSPGYICTGGTETLTANGAVTYQWAPTSSLNTSTGATVISSATVTTTYSVVGTNSNGCTSQTTVQVSVNSTAPPPAGAITGPTNVCSGQAGVIYTVPGVTPPVPIRTWTVPAGAIITAGQGTRSVTVTFGSTTGQVCCTTSNACGSAIPTCLTVTVDPTPAVSAPGPISGPTVACDNQTGVVYTIAPVANASGYNWTVSGDANIVAGQGTTTVTVDYGTNNNINVCVTANNSCGTSPPTCITVTVSPNTPAIPGAITGPTTVCANQTGVNYSVGAVANAVVYTWSVPPGASITAGQGTRTITVTYAASSGTVCVNAGNGCGTSLDNCIAITVDPAAPVGTVGSITGPTAVCANQTGLIYSISAVTNATAYNWTVPPGASITAGQGTTTITVTFGASGGNVCVDASNGCSVSAPGCLAVSVDPSAPAIPGAITGPTTVCNGQQGVNYSVSSVPNTTVYSWTVPSGANIVSGQGTPAITVNYGATSGTVCVTAGNACGTSLGSCTNITVDPAGAVGTIGTITGPTAVCANQTNVNYSIGAVINASTYNWTVPAGASITAGQGTTTITVTFGATPGNVCVDASNSCSSTSQVCVAVTVSGSAPAIPAGITGLTTVCNGQTGVAYSIASVSGATVYTWTVPSGATVASGQGTTAITVNYGATSGTVCVTAGNACGTSLGSCITVSVDPNGPVDTVGVISGPSSVCANQTNVNYSIAPVANASAYNWTVPAGASITAGQNTTTVTVTFGATPGNVCVDASNSCSASAANCFAVTVDPVAPAIPGLITGPTTVCNGQTGVNYSISSVANASVYTWTVPSGASVTAGQGTTSITVTFGATSGTVCVTAGNSCGTSLGSCQTITVDPTPAVGPVGTITGPTAVCANQTNVNYSIAAVANASTYNWTVPSGASITAGQGTTAITVTFGNVSGNICVDASNSCGTSAPSCLTLTVSPSAPAIPTGITGATTVCSGQSGVTYSISPVTNALSYVWTVPAGAIIVSGQGTTSITVNFGTASGNICVAAGNGCGNSLPSCQAITVSSAVLGVNSIVQPATCSSCCDGAANATPSGGTAPYTYSWNTSPVQTTATATGLCASTGYTVCVTDAGGCVTCDTVFVPFTIGIASVTDNGTIKVYPNPANEYIMIEGTLSTSALLDITITSVYGQKMTDRSVHVNGAFSQRLSMTELPSGVYFIEIKSGELLKATKIVKVQ